MLGKLFRTAPRPAESTQAGAAVPGAATPTGPADDDLATILALVVVSDFDVPMIVQRTGFSAEVATTAVAELERRGVVGDAGGGFYKASQASCPGTCWRGGHELRGQEIVITPPRFEWWCAPCWDAERGSTAPSPPRA